MEKCIVREGRVVTEAPDIVRMFASKDYITVNLEDLYYQKPSLETILKNVAKGNISHSTDKEGIDLWKCDDGSLMVVDGYHRTIEMLLNGVRNVKARIVAYGYDDIHSTPLKGPIFKPTDQKFGGLEAFASVEQLEDIKRKVNEYRKNFQHPA